MMTGDNEKTARAVAEAVGVDAYFAERPARGQGELHPPRARGGPQGHHARRRRKRLARRSPRPTRASPSATARPSRARWPTSQLGGDDLYALLTLKRLSDALMEPHSQQLPQDHQLQLPADLPGCGRCSAACDLCAAAQRLRAGRQSGKRASPATGNKNGPSAFFGSLYPPFSEWIRLLSFAYNSAKESVRDAFLLQKQLKCLNHRKEMACECCDFGRQRMHGAPL